MNLGQGGRRYCLRKAIDRFGTGLTLVAVIVAIVPLGAMLYYVVAQGGSSLNLDFFTHGPVPTGESGGGMFPMIAGTLELILLSSLIGMPIGIMAGIYLARSTNLRFAQVVRFVTDVIAGTPSIVAGVVAYALLVVSTGYSAISAALALGLLMFPTVTRATEAAIRLVPDSVREAALSLGVPEWKTMVKIVLPTAASGIVTAIMLGIARVSGETAPLVFTAFGNNNFQFSPLHPIGALPLQIWIYATSPYSDWQRQAWAGALVLFAIILLLNLSARILTYRLTRQTGRA